MEIKKLSDKIINLIAAGEVVERPMSVIKELAENSLDAGANQIEIHIENGGKNFISVADNGAGIPKNQVELAFERHATSKIDNDIFNVNSFGFRGEALPSIASVSKVIVDSNAHEQQYIATFEHGNFTEFKPSRRQQGTKIVVQDLFANTPVRLKFLKSDKSEVMACANLVKKLALVNYGVEFKFYSDGKLVLHYSKADSSDERIEDVLGTQFMQNSIPIKFNDSRVEFYGRVGYPTHNKGMPHYIYNFVNGRVVRDKFLAQVVRNAYINLIPNGKYPETVLFFKFDNSEVDVNIHPSKQEIRLVDEHHFKALIQSQIRRVLKEQNLQNNTVISDSLNQSFKVSSANTDTAKQSTTTKGGRTYNSSSIYNNHSGRVERACVHAGHKLHERISKYNASGQNDLQSRINQQFIVDDLQAEAPPLGYAKCQIANSYIVAENGDDLVIIDQHAAHERVNLEKFKNTASFVESQALTVPMIVKFGDSTEVDKIIQHQQLFEKYGLIFGRNGVSEIAISSLNSLISAEDAQILLQQFLHDSNIDAIEDKLVEILGNIACKKSVKAGKRMSIEEMNALLRQMERTEHASNCNHGRPTFITLSKDKLAKLFER